MNKSLWQLCAERLQSELSAQNFNTWIRPLQSEFDGNVLILYAPNSYVVDWVKDKYLNQINEYLTAFASARNEESPRVAFRVGGIETNAGASPVQDGSNGSQISTATVTRRQAQRAASWSQNATPMPAFESNIDEEYTFDNFVEGKSNQLALAAARQVAENPGGVYNPLFVYGGTGLGKTHLLHAVGNAILAHKKDAKVFYMRAERFVQDMVNALKNGTLDEMKRYYRSVDALLIDDIHFFSNKKGTQEEFFHTFNALLEGNQQIILTSDLYPKEIEGLEDRLRSRFGWGLTIAIEPPELETRVAILIRKAQERGIQLPHEVAFFIAKRLRSNVRELEGALNRLVANVNLTGRAITIDFVREALRDLIAAQEKLVTIENIQKTVAEYYNIKMSDMLSKRRTRSIARPRQMAMALAKELTNHSLPEIGDAFGGRDHTTVLHACRVIAKLKDSQNDLKEDYRNLIRTLSA